MRVVGIFFIIMTLAGMEQSSDSSDDSIVINMEHNFDIVDHVDPLNVAQSLYCGNNQLPELVIQNFANKWSSIEPRFDRKSFETAMRELLAEQYDLRHSPQSHFYTHRKVHDCLNEAIVESINESLALKERESELYRTQRSLAQSQLQRERIKFKATLVGLASTIVIGATSLAAVIVSNS